MNAWHAAQLVLTCIALAQLTRLARVVVWHAPSDHRALTDAFAVALKGGQRSLAEAMVVACLPAWTAQLFAAGLEGSDGARPEDAMDEVRAALVEEQADHLRTLAAMGRIAGPLAFLAIVLELGAAFGPGHGLAALQRGLVQSIAIQSAALSFSIGLGTTLVCAASATFLRERLRSLSDELKRSREVAARAFRADPDM